MGAYLSQPLNSHDMKTGYKSENQKLIKEAKLFAGLIGAIARFPKLVSELPPVQMY